MKIMIAVGTRPNFVKAAPLVRAVREYNERIVARRADRLFVSLVHTGQHYDKIMFESVLTDLELPEPDIHLGVGAGPQAAQTADILRNFAEVLEICRPDIVVVVGDATSTLACALATDRVSHEHSGVRPLIAHVEAGLRSFDKSMPEEINRILTDHLSDLLFVSEESGLRNLRHEGIPDDRVHFVGNIMIDSMMACSRKSQESAVLRQLGLQHSILQSPTTENLRSYAVLTLHRPSNVDHRSTLLRILEGLEELATNCPIIFPVHPRTRKRIREFGLDKLFRSSEIQGVWNAPNRESCSPVGIITTEPLGYLDFLCLLRNAALVITDSGGIQEETTCLGVPCVTVRQNTERPITVSLGTNMIAGNTREEVQAAVKAHRHMLRTVRVPEKWDGKAGQRIIAILAEALMGRSVHRVATAEH